MNKRSVLILAIFVMALLGVASCGGGASSLELNAAGPMAGATTPLGAVLPGLPAGSGVAARSASDIVEIPGAAAIESAGATIVEDNLLLQSSATEMAWGLYKVDGLAGRQPTTLEMEFAVPAGTEYSVGISNFSDGVWDFLAVSSESKFVADLSAEVAQMANEVGELYFVVVVSGGAAVTVHSASLESEVDDSDEDELPMLAGGLTVSEGLADSIVIAWAAAEGATGYELWRQADIEGADEEWLLLATLDAATLTYTDMDIALSTEYEYRVRAISDAGAAGFGESESGYAGDPPAGDDDSVGGGDDNGGGDNGSDDGIGGDDNSGDGNGSDDGTGGDDNGGDDSGADDGTGSGGGSDDSGAGDGAGAGV